MGVPFSSQAYNQLVLLGVVPSVASLHFSAWDRSAPLLVALGFWLGLDQQWFVCTYMLVCMHDVSVRRTMGGSVLAPLARYTPEGQSQKL